MYMYNDFQTREVNSQNQLMIFNYSSLLFSCTHIYTTIYMKNPSVCWMNTLGVFLSENSEFWHCLEMKVSVPESLIYQSRNPSGCIMPAFQGLQMLLWYFLLEGLCYMPTWFLSEALIFTILHPICISWSTYQSSWLTFALPTGDPFSADFTPNHKTVHSKSQTYDSNCIVDCSH